MFRWEIPHNRGLLHNLQVGATVFQMESAMGTALHDSLLTLIREVRRGTIGEIDRTEEHELLWRPPGTNNHILWHAGHCVWLQDRLCLDPVTGRREISRAWRETFGADCRPVSETTEWPAKGEMLEALRDQLARLEEAVGGLGPDDFLAPEPVL